MCNEAELMFLRDKRFSRLDTEVYMLLSESSEQIARQTLMTETELAKRLGKCRRTVQSSIRRLRETGFIQTKFRGLNRPRWKILTPLENIYKAHVCLFPVIQEAQNVTLPVTHFPEAKPLPTKSQEAQNITPQALYSTYSIEGVMESYKLFLLKHAQVHTQKEKLAPKTENQEEVDMTWIEDATNMEKSIKQSTNEWKERKQIKRESKELDLRGYNRDMVSETKEKNHLDILLAYQTAFKRTIGISPRMAKENKSQARAWLKLWGSIGNGDGRFDDFFRSISQSPQG